MTQPIHSDPEHLKQVVTDMVRLSADLSAQMETLEYSLAALGRTWEDEQFLEFRQLVQKTMLPVKGLHEEMKKHRSQMESDIEALAAYQAHQIGD